MDPADIDAVLTHLIDHGFIGDDGVWLSMGEAGEKQFGRRHFLELVSVFTSSPSFEVLHGNSAIGSLDWLSLVQGGGDGRHPIILAGRTWEVQSIDWRKRRLFVTPSQEKGKVNWKGLRRGLSLAVAQRVRDLLLSVDQSPRWSSRARDEMLVQRQALGSLAGQCGRLWRDATEDRLRWTTFAGYALNGVLGSILESRLSLEVTWDDFELSMPSSTDAAAVRGLAAELLQVPRIIDLIPQNQELVDQLKFSTCLPDGLAKRAVHGRQDLSQLRPVLESITNEMGGSIDA